MSLLLSNTKSCRIIQSLDLCHCTPVTNDLGRSAMGLEPTWLRLKSRKVTTGQKSPIGVAVVEFPIEGRRWKLET